MESNWYKTFDFIALLICFFSYFYKTTYLFFLIHTSILRLPQKENFY